MLQLRIIHMSFSKKKKKQYHYCIRTIFDQVFIFDFTDNE